MKLIVNNKEVETTANHLLQFAKELGLPEKGVALAVNQRMIPRAQWEDYALTEGMSIIIIKAVCGG